MESLHHIVDLLTRPIEFATRDGYAHLATVRDLGAFVSRQVIEALSERVYPQPVETDLLALRQLFSDYDRNLGAPERQQRLAEALTILRRLRTLTGPSGAQGTILPPAWEPPPATVTGGSRSQATLPTPSPRTHSPQAAPSVPLWKLPIRSAKGVGPKRAVLLEKVGVRTVEEALWFLPWRYEDRSVVIPIGQLTPGSFGTICGTVRRCILKRTARRRMAILEVAVEDASGLLTGIFFNQAYLEKTLEPGTRVMLSGTVSGGRRGWMDPRMEGPQYEVLTEDAEAPLHVGRIVPIYHETKGLTSRWLRLVMKGLLDEYREALEDVVPASLRAKLGLPTIGEAMAEVHFPGASVDLPALDRGTTLAHRRLAFEEFLLLELALAFRHREVKEEKKGITFNPAPAMLSRLRERLAFRLTAAQERVLSEIQADMKADRPMNRLLQGDVGCGKTVVALQAMVIACGSGYQAALMVPTEILAEQHYLNLREQVQPLGLTVALLRSGGPAKHRREALRQIESGEAHLVIGTHALIQKGVRFANLGLTVIDEQHRFGVLQRKTLLDKGYHPDVLVMTATPIPRTLAMTVYGDLDVSVIDALPPGRQPVQTLLFTVSQRRKAYRLLEKEVRAGRQAFIVYPLVEESEKVDLQAAIQAAERLQAQDFAWARVGVLHGRLKTEAKDEVMAAFKAGRIQILVTTTVVEVGVDVRNATVMLVEHAERFGLAQLHQLRGRVGRGSHRAYCLLLMSGGAGQGQRDTDEAEVGRPGRALPSGSSARRRLEALVHSSDGFVIAEEDLRIRGPGEFFGVRQWGVPEFRAANLIRDGVLLERARQEAWTLLESDPSLTASEHLGLRSAMIRLWKEKLALGSVS